MNVLGKNARSWRKGRKRAVSPIIATILLVAITVVLAAVLYVLISGLTHGTGSAPLGTNFSWGSPVNVTGVATTGCGTPSTAHNFCYSIEIAGSSVSTSNFILALRNTAGGTIAWPVTVAAGYAATPTASQISLISPTASAPQSGYSTSTSGWTPNGAFSGSVTGGFSIVIYLQGSATVNAGLLGYELVAIGASGYSGSVPSNAFN
jgi:flagellin-like protein